MQPLRVNLVRQAQACACRHREEQDEYARAPPNKSKDSTDKRQDREGYCCAGAFRFPKTIRAASRSARHFDFLADSIERWRALINNFTRTA